MSWSAVNQKLGRDTHLKRSVGILNEEKLCKSEARQRHTPREEHGHPG